MLSRLGHYICEDLHKSFASWGHGDVAGTLIAAIVALGLALLSTFGLKVSLDPTVGHFWQWTLGAWFLFLVLIVTPFRMWLFQILRAEKLEEEAKPKIMLAFGEDIIGCIKEHREPQNNFRRILSINVLVKSAATVHGCIGSLITIDKQVNGTWERQRTFAGSQTLNWHFYGLGKLAVPINPGDERVLHVLFIREVDGGIEIAGHNPDVPSIALVNSHGVFAFHISVAGDNTPAAYIDFLFERGSTWDKPRVSKL